MFAFAKSQPIANPILDRTIYLFACLYYDCCCFIFFIHLFLHKSSTEGIRQAQRKSYQICFKYSNIAVFGKMNSLHNIFVWNDLKSKILFIKVVRMKSDWKMCFYFFTPKNQEDRYIFFFFLPSDIYFLGNRRRLLPTPSLITFFT